MSNKEKRNHSSLRHEKETSPEDFRSREVEDIISERSDFWGRWALPIFLFILLLMVAGTWFIRYPDTVKATATLNAANGPRALVSRKEGKLIHLFKHNGDTVKTGTAIGWIESTGSHRQILLLTRNLDSALQLLNRNSPEKIQSLFRSRFNDLGELQPSYQEFSIALQQFTDYLTTGYYLKKKHNLLADIAFLKKNRAAIHHQIALTKQDIALATKDFEANKKLYQEQVLSDLDYRQSKSAYLNKRQALPQLEQSLTNNLHQEADQKAEIAELNHTISKQKQIFLQKLHTFQSEVDLWISKNIIKAPVSGTVVFLLPLQKNTFLHIGEKLGYVNPLNSTYYARIHFSQHNFGKVAVGQPVQLRVESYPYEQFGILNGRLSYISNVASDSGFLGRVELPNGLQTEYNKTIQFRSGLHATAIIISKPMRLLQRFYYNMMKKVNQ